MANLSAANQLNTQDFMHAIDMLGIGGADVCIHASIKSFGAPLQCGLCRDIRCVFAERLYHPDPQLFGSV